MERADTIMPDVNELENELIFLDERRRVVAALLSALREYNGSAATSEHGVTPIKRISEKRGRRPAPIVVATEEVALDLMDKTGLPVTTSDVLSEMQNRNISLPDRNPLNVISARLSNSDKFVGKRGRGYWFADRAWPTDDWQELLG